MEWVHACSRLERPPGAALRRDGCNYNAAVLVSSSAPTRIDLAGGTLDIWPLYLFHPGAQTVNAALGIRASCTVRSRDDDRVVLRSSDTGLTLEAADWQSLGTEGDGRLLAHLGRFFELSGVEVTTNSGSPMGAGIAGSSALTVAICAALTRWQRRSLSPDQLLTLAMNLDARTLGLPTGVQASRPALYGGVSAVELGPLGVERIPLEVDVTELERRLVLCYSGNSRSSGLNNWDITRRYIEGDETLAAHFTALRDIAAETRQALNTNDWHELARQMSREWDTRQALAPGVTTPAIDQILSASRAAGAMSGKVCGAGGGGCVCLLIDPDRRDDVYRSLVDSKAQVLECRIDTDGLRVDATED